MSIVGLLSIPIIRLLQLDWFVLYSNWFKSLIYNSLCPHFSRDSGARLRRLKWLYGRRRDFVPLVVSISPHILRGFVKGNKIIRYQFKLIHFSCWSQTMMMMSLFISNLSLGGFGFSLSLAGLTSSWINIRIIQQDEAIECKSCSTRIKLLDLWSLIASPDPELSAPGKTESLAVEDSWLGHLKCWAREFIISSYRWSFSLRLLSLLLGAFFFR